MKMKRTFSLIILTTILLAVIFSNAALAASMKDYKALKYATINDSGANTVTIEGRGIMSVKQGSSSDDATAVIFKDYVDPKNFKATLEFIKDYGDGSGPQAGWYSINLSKSPNWFTSVNSIIKANNINGVNIIFKLDSTDKKKAFIEIAKYTPGSGFKSLLGSTITVTLKNDWKCLTEVKAGKLYVDDTFITDLNDAIDITMPEGKAFAGFGGLSEEFKGIKFNVTLDAAATKDAIEEYAKTSNTDSNAAAVTSDSTSSTTATAVTDNSTSDAAPSTSSKPVNVTLIVIIIAGVLIIGVVSVVLIRKSKKS